MTNRLEMELVDATDTADMAGDDGPTDETHYNCPLSFSRKEGSIKLLGKSTLNAACEEFYKQALICPDGAGLLTVTEHKKNRHCIR